MYFSAVIPVLAIFSGQTLAGVLDAFNATSDYNAAWLMDSLFGIFGNGTHLILDGNSQNPIEKDVTFLCGYGNVQNLTQTTIGDSSFSSKVNTTKPIVFITHGWLNNGYENWIKLMAADYFTFFDTNVCVVNWGNLAFYGYAIAANYTYEVGDYLAKFVSYINDQGIPLSNVTLVGHSMGAQISGQTGKVLNGKIGAIYGLDPASPLFKMPVDVGPANRLDKTDAQYVQMIITSRCTWGVCAGDGHENFYPTGGLVPQPNCVLPLGSNAETAVPISCSHVHAISLFRMALNPKNVFLGKRCINYVAYLARLPCLFNPTTKMGIYTGRVGGDFYLMTSVFAPYTVGLFGSI